MTTHGLVQLVLIGMISQLLAITAQAEEAAEQQIALEVRRLLESRCVACHGPDTQEGGLRLDASEHVLRGGERGPAAIPGKPHESLMLKAVLHENANFAMPPKEKLPAGDVAVLERWIREGAVWSAQPEPEPSARGNTDRHERIGDAWSDPRNPITKIFHGERLDLWSLQPIKRPALPEVRNTAWVRNEIDHFVLANLEAAGLAPSPEADRRTLARRLYFDITGLPPEDEDVQRFLADARPDAYERLVDELLASPRYGEHAARMWLDVVRYSDSNGFDWDEYRPQAWRYRDYVIAALNNDMPFDRFVREQLAGDETIAGPPKTKAEQDALIATGYLRLGPQDNSAQLFNEQPRARAEWMADLVETTGSAFLGLTFSCCRCHHHKYDPLSQADHFRLRAFFEPLRYADDVPIDLADERQAIDLHNTQIDTQVQPLEEKRKSLFEGVKQDLRTSRIAGLSETERNLLNATPDTRSDEQRPARESLEKRVQPTDDEVRNAFSTEQKEQDEKLKGEADSLKQGRRTLTHALIATDQQGEVPATRVLYAGNHTDPREIVPAGFLSILDPNPAVIRRPDASGTHGRRLALADWIVSERNPLTARVLVNRLWQQHFGAGLVATPSDFGLAGERPSHPELLDWLSVEIRECGWSLKQLHRLIVISAAYRQQSIKRPDADRVDANNKLLARQNLRRLSAEQLRDSLLSVSGLLNNKAGGPPVWPELPPEVLQANPALLDDNAEKTKGWYPSSPTDQLARSVFLIQKRTVRVPFMESFDLPENSTSCARRTSSIVAPQALSLLNSPLAVQASKALADRARRQSAGDIASQIRAAFHIALQREPTEHELESCKPIVQEHGLVELCRVMVNLNEFIYVD